MEQCHVVIDLCFFQSLNPIGSYPKIFFCFQIQYPIVTADAYENHFLSIRVYLTGIRSIM